MAAPWMAACLLISPDILRPFDAVLPCVSEAAVPTRQHAASVMAMIDEVRCRCGREGFSKRGVFMTIFRSGFPGHPVTVIPS